MLAIAAPVTVFDMADVIASSGGCPRFVWDVTRYQLTRGQSYAIRNEQGQAVAIGGFWPSEHLRETWLWFSPAAAQRMREVVRLARLTLSQLPQHDPRPVIAVVRTPAGARIARILGLQPHGGGLWSWEPSHGRDR